jgi:hypothetical protein
MMWALMARASLTPANSGASFGRQCQVLRPERGHQLLPGGKGVLHEEQLAALLCYLDLHLVRLRTGEAGVPGPETASVREPEDCAVVPFQGGDMLFNE